MDLFRLPISLSTDLVEPTLFRPHGDIKVATDGTGLVVYFAQGPFNQELVEALDELESSFLREVRAAAGDWREIIIFQRSCAMGNEVVNSLESYFRKLQNECMGQRSAALVFEGEVEAQRLIEPLLTKMYDDLGIKNEVFQSVEDAWVWSKKN